MIELQKGMRNATEVNQNKQSPNTESLFYNNWRNL